MWLNGSLGITSTPPGDGWCSFHCRCATRIYRHMANMSIAIYRYYRSPHSDLSPQGLRSSPYARLKQGTHSVIPNRRTDSHSCEVLHHDSLGHHRMRKRDRSEE